MTSGGDRQLFERLDHVAVEVSDFQGWLEALTAVCNMRLLRDGARYRTGGRIAMLGDGTGVKIELIEGRCQAPTVAHVAFRVGDADLAFRALVSQGWEPKNPPHDLAAARARTALLSLNNEVDIQVIAYQPDSPDIAEWPQDPVPSRGQAPGPATRAGSQPAAGREGDR